MNYVEAEGDSIDAAIERAIEILGVARERVEIEILSNASRGLLGIGGRKAKVRATLRRAFSFAVDEAPAEQPHETPAAERAPSRPEAARRHGAADEVVPLDDAALERARSILQQLVDHIGSPGRVAVVREEEETRLVIDGDESGILIGRRGQTLDALEYLVNRIVSREEDSTARLSIDSQNYRTRRRTALTDLAKRVAERARRRGRTVTLNPMSPRDRRIVHLALRDDPSLTTRSAGNGYFRKLLIIPNSERRRDRHA